MIDLVARRRFFAEEIEAVAGLQTADLVEALASVSRERFLPPGPWLVRGEADLGAAPRATADADPRRAYHNYSIAIDAGRQLFNGAPGVVARVVDALALARGARVLHVGAGLGYYSALLAHVAGPSGRVVAIEIDPALAAAAATNLAGTPWVEVRCGNGFPNPGESFDAILVNAGVTHVHPEWLNAMAPGARAAVPLTATMPGMAATLGKGVSVLFTRTSGEDLAARVLGFIAIYSGLDLRDDATNARLGQALMRAPWPPFKRLRRDEHPETAQCWLHTSNGCLSME